MMVPFRRYYQLSHISSLEALGRASNYNWDRFIDMVDLAFPKQNQQIKFYFDDIYYSKSETKSNDDFDKGIDKIIGFEEN